MKIEQVKIGDIKPNPSNPRLIKDDKFRKLVKSIQDFPQMMEIRPIVVNEDMVILGGNMRWKAAKEAGMKTVPVIKASELTENQQREFIIKDNVGFGEWDWEALANEWSDIDLGDWSLDIPNFTVPKDLDYSILDGEDMSGQLAEMSSGVKKAIQIEFEAEHYTEAADLVKFWREQGLYIGGFLMEKLKEEKSRL